MNIPSNWLKRTLLAACFLSALVHAEDIDIFTGTTAVDTSLPNVIFVLDNTSNWSRSSQKWPGGVDQGQSEVRAIKLALANKVNKLNVGIMEYVTGDSSADTDAAYTRFNLRKLDATALTALNTTLDTIFNNINSPNEKRSSSNPYGYLPWDFYNYLGGFTHSKNGAGSAPYADPAAYDPGQVHSNFLSPIVAANACADTYMVFIGNNANGAVKGDDATNTAALKALYSALGKTAPNALAGDSSGTALGMPGFSCTQVTSPGPIITPGVAAYCDPPVQPADVCTGVQNFAAITNQASTACWKTLAYDAAAATKCTAAENLAGGKCFGRSAGNCSCTAVRTSAATGWNTPACNPSPTSNPQKDRTFRWNVNGAAYTIPAACVTPPPTQQCYGAVLEVRGPDVVTDVCEPTNTVDTTTGKAYNFDDWALFLKKQGVPATVPVDGQPVQQRVKVTTYTIDVFNAQQSSTLSSVWFSAANAGGGRYFQAKNEQQLITAINSIASDIIAESSSFAAVSLPLSATNRAQVDNQLYIGMFRPSLGKKPRWFGNLKRYQLALFNDIPGLADASLELAANTNDGNLRTCAKSFWTEDSNNYWETLDIDPSVESGCLEAGVELWSDLPDGDFVEKGGVAQQRRQLARADIATRTLYTAASDTALRALAASDIPDTAVFNYLRGTVAGTDEVLPAAGLRASIHGDVVHSAPLAIRYSPTTVSLFYGANDGLFRAVNAADGNERWALLAPEHFGKIQRLYNNTPLIKYTGTAQAGEELKDYFFDGPTGELLIYEDNDGNINDDDDGDTVKGEIKQAYIYLTQRRGGRMIYALDVTNPTGAPDLLWRVGCYTNLSNNTEVCSTGFNNIGQTWSTPVGGFAKGYVDGSNNPKQIVAFGGGFDDCLNEDVAAYPAAACSSAKGKGVYILDAATGVILADPDVLPTDAPVITKLSPIDIDFDGNLDFFYAADVAGDLYRISLTSMAAVNLANLDDGFNLTALEKDDWAIVKIGSVADGERRFYNAPTAGAFQGVVAVTVGSGDRERPLEINYPFADEVQNRFYALFDEPYKTFVANPVGELEDDEATTVDLDGDTMLAVEPDGDETDFSQEFDGWYMDLPDRGEQVANPSVIGGGRVFFNTFQPGGDTDQLCERPLGIGKGYEVSLFGPESTEGEEIEAPGFPIPPAIFTVLLPRGLPDCEGNSCPTPPQEQCTTQADDCRMVTLCIGCRDLGDIPEIIPDAPPLRRRVFFTEDIDRKE